MRSADIGQERDFATDGYPEKFLGEPGKSSSKGSSGGKGV
jgi:hypothetical protein